MYLKKIIIITNFDLPKIILTYVCEAVNSSLGLMSVENNYTLDILPILLRSNVESANP